MLLTLALVYFLLLEKTAYPLARRRALGLVLLVAILLQSGGFFVHMLAGEEARSSVGTLLTRIGAVLLAAALIALGVGILRMGRSTPASIAND